MNKNQIREIFEELELSTQVEILHSREGENNKGYVIQTPIEKYILKEYRKGKAAETSKLKHESIVLKFLESKSIDFVPKVVYYDEEKDFLILDFIEGEDKRLDQLNEEEVADLGIKLCQIHNLKCEDFKEYCKDCEHETENFESSLDILKKYTLEPFEIIEKDCDDNEIVEYLRELVKGSMVAFRKGEEDMFFAHGDIPTNLIANNNQIHIIDWEYARFILAKGTELGFMFKQYDLTKEMRKVFIDNYLKKSKLTQKELNEKINFEIRNSLVNDILWAAMMYTKKKKKDEKDCKKYYDMTQKRIKAYKDKTKEFNHENS